jgi:hypothetical protein
LIFVRRMASVKWQYTLEVDVEIANAGGAGRGINAGLVVGGNTHRDSQTGADIGAAQIHRAVIFNMRPRIFAVAPVWR